MYPQPSIITYTTKDIIIIMSCLSITILARDMFILNNYAFSSWYEKSSHGNCSLYLHKILVNSSLTKLYRTFYSKQQLKSVQF